MEEADLRCGGGGAVGDMEDFGGAPAGGGKVGGVTCEAGAGGFTRVADRGRYGAIEYAALDEAGCERAVEAVTEMLRLFTFLAGCV